MTDTLRLPLYNCHKQVRAAKITGIASAQFGIRPPLYTLYFGELHKEVQVDAAWFNKHEPCVGGYYVIYSDGYSSFSPEKCFEDGYTRATDE